MTAFLLAVFCAVFILSALRIAKTKKAIRHDRVLFSFNQLQRDIMSFLRANAFEKSNALSRDEYVYARRLLAAIDEVVDDHHNKTAVFDLRNTEKHLRAYREIIAPLPKIPGNPELLELHKRFRVLLARAFIAYTPLIRWEILLRMIARAYRAGYRLGVESRARRHAEYVLNNAPKVLNDLQYFRADDGGGALAKAA